MHKINLTEAEACLAALVKEVANGEGSGYNRGKRFGR